MKFTTPGGNEADIFCREGTNDQMTADIDILQDRYGIKDWPRGGLLIDVGTHIGTVMVAALLDDPARTAIAVEPLPANIIEIVRNASKNGLADRVEVHQGAFSKRKVKIPHGFRGSEQATMHRYIGGFNLDLLPADTEYDIEEARAIPPDRVLDRDVTVLKVAGETAERALVGADLSRVSFIIGKYHSHIPKLVPWLEKTHEVETYPDRDQPDRAGFGWYRGVLR